MPFENLEPAWYALTVKPRHEGAVAQHLNSKNLDGFAPVYRVRRRWSDRFKEIDAPLFPGYVFCRFGYRERMTVLNTLGVTSIVGFGKTAAPVADEEMVSVRRMTASRLPIEPWPYLRAGQKIRVEEGCLAGVTGIILRERDWWRVVVSVELLQRSVAVEIDRQSLYPEPPFSLPHPISASFPRSSQCPS